MDYRRSAPSLRQVHAQLGALLKSEIAIQPLSQPRRGAFRSYASRAISVMALQGGAICMHKSASHSTDVHVLRLRSGSAQLVHADGCTRVEAGQFVAYRGGEALQFRHDDSIDLLSMFLPARALERWLPDWQAAEFVTVPDQQAEGRLSFDIARDLLDCGRELHDPSAGELVAETVTRLLARSLAMTSLNAAAAPESLAEAQRRRVRQFCRKQLCSPVLSVDSVARATGMSRASLHRLFHDQPHTLMQWVQRERLEACRRSLAEGALPARTLTEIALAHGFKSSAHFSAAFRQRYGLAPREYRALSTETLAQAYETQL